MVFPAEQGLGQAWQALGQLGHKTNEVAATIADLLGQQCGRARHDVVPEGFDERLVGNEGLLVAPPEQHGRPLLLDATRELARHRGLADAGLAGEEHELALARLRPLPRRLEGGQLFCAADEDRRTGDGKDGWDPSPSSSLALRRPLELVAGNVYLLRRTGRFPRTERVLASRVDQPMDHARHEDLAGLGGAAESLGEHHRSAQVLLFVSNGFPGVEGDTRRRLATAGGPRRRPLDGLRADDSLHGAAEDDDDAVAQDLERARRGGGPSHQLQVQAASVVGRVESVGRRSGLAEEVGHRAFRRHRCCGHVSCPAGPGGRGRRADAESPAHRPSSRTRPRRGCRPPGARPARPRT